MITKLFLLWSKKFATSGIKDIIIDLSMVTMMSSMGIGTLLACHTMLVKVEGKLIIAQPSEQIVKLLNMNKLINILNTSDTVEEAYKTYGIE